MTHRAFVSRFSPNRTDPKLLEAIFVQREELADRWLRQLRDSITTGTKHHLLAIGPRGCGKSHLVSILVHRAKKDADLRGAVRIARLPEDETTTSFWKFLLRILRALNADYGDEFPPPPRDRIESVDDERRTAFLTKYLLEKLGSHSLLIVVENLDDVLRGLKEEGQKRWRAFLQEHVVTATLATSQQLTEDLSGRDRPFFNFFQIDHLKPLSVDEALLLLRKLAEENKNTELASFLKTPTGRARIRAIRHVTGGSHRVFIILSEFATRENLDNLVMAFEELLDDLTPYYQERLRWLPDQQREIVEFLCRQAETVSVKTIAEGLFLSEQVAAAQLKSLRDKGYVTAGSVGRESRYELAEPLMRLCIEVKNPAREPIRLIVEFLQIWYDHAEVAARLDCLTVDAELERRYLRAAFEALASGAPKLVDTYLVRDLESARLGDPDEMVRVLDEILATTDSSLRCLEVAGELIQLEQREGAISAYDRAIELDPGLSMAFSRKALALELLHRQDEAFLLCQHAIELDRTSALNWGVQAVIFLQANRSEEALVSIEKSIDLDPTNARAWSIKGTALRQLGRYEAALEAVNRSIELNPGDSGSWIHKARVQISFDRHADALVSVDKAIRLGISDHPAFFLRGVANRALGRNSESIADFRRADELEPNQPDVCLNLAETLVLENHWDEAEKRLSQRFLLAPPPDVSEFLVNMFQVASKASVQEQHVLDLAASANEVPLRVAPQDRSDPSGYRLEVPADSSMLQVVGMSLILSLTANVYTENVDLLDRWEKAWQKAAKQYPELSFSVRLFSVGIQYIRTRDERILLDLVQEERFLIRDLFNLGKP